MRRQLPRRLCRACHAAMVSVCYGIELHDSSDIVRACVRSHESGIKCSRYTIRTVTVLASHGSQFQRSSYTVPCGGILTRWTRVLEDEGRRCVRIRR